MGVGGWLVSALMPAVGAVGAWWLRDNPLPFEQDRLNPFSAGAARRFYGIAAVVFALGALACLGCATAAAL